LLALHKTLVAIVSLDTTWSEASNMVITGNRKAKAHASRMVDIIMNPAFWHAIARCCILIFFCASFGSLFQQNLFRIKWHLEPLAIVVNITQASFCHLNTVLLTFGFLIMQY